MRTACTLHVKAIEEWHAWLGSHHATAPEVWLVFWKQASRRTQFSYEEAVEEALCFGWIDSLVRAMEGEKYARKFTPRNPGSKWSELNRRRAAKLRMEGRMTEAGMAVLGGALTPEGTTPPPAAKDFPLPPFMEKAIRADSAAWANFNGLAPSYRRLYIRWVTAAKKQETRDRRLREAVDLLRQNRKLGLK